jgi:ABC-2 type transport system ATP-binding protein
MIEFTTAEHNPASLLKSLINNDVEVINFGQKDPNLEDVFMMVTKGLVS